MPHERGAADGNGDHDRDPPALDGEAWTVTGIEVGRLVLKSARGQSVVMDTAAVPADPSTSLPGAGDEPASCGPLLDDLTAAESGELGARLRHQRDVGDGGGRAMRARLPGL